MFCRMWFSYTIHVANTRLRQAHKEHTLRSTTASSSLHQQYIQEMFIFTCNLHIKTVWVLCGAYVWGNFHLYFF